MKNQKVAFCFVFFILFFSIRAFPEAATRIFINGNLWTADSGKPKAEALALHGDKILAVGTNDEIRALANEKTEVIDLKGRLMVPGFNDAHIHFLVRSQVELEESDALKTIQDKVSAYAKENPAAAWILGRGWGYASFPQNKPHRSMIDAIVSDRPVVLEERDGHMLLANSKAFAIANITKDTADPEHGRIVRDDKGEPTGELQESAMQLLDRVIPDASVDELYSNLKQLLDRAASYGLTSVQNASFDESRLPVFDRVLAENGLKVRFYWAIPFHEEPTAEDLARYKSFSKKIS